MLGDVILQVLSLFAKHINSMFFVCPPIVSAFPLLNVVLYKLNSLVLEFKLSLLSLVSAVTVIFPGVLYVIDISLSDTLYQVSLVILFTLSLLQLYLLSSKLQVLTFLLDIPSTVDFK